ncbi:hypothetical protein BBJ29_002230 [Phytophthora kernoviae]|uniref:GTP-binding protein Parf n=1 Tax=Phytophthora kernoviae TaxID=325452 RepID=A0A3F2RV77_9STRA|nr:hypothetical protein BBJ29_002230 [Phytophthora kernoviae]RLN64860.1 hypothetical protein BBP00_00003203 [Phytophthora kernoviae]
MGNEVSRPSGLSPQDSGAVLPPSSPYTPTGASGRTQSFSTRSPSPQSRPPTPPSRRTSSSGSLPSPANPRKDRNIQRMDRAIRRRVRGGVTYNMKLLLRGAKGTGKTSLFQRLQGEPIPETHQSTPELQSATINWSFRTNLEENVKCEVWDVVDRGFVIQVGTEETVNGSAAVSADSVEQGGLQSGGSLSAEAAAAAVAAASTVSSMSNGMHSVAIVDASTVDVYHEAHGVIFLLDVTKWDTLEYVKQQLDNVPVHIPTLVLGNFRDQGAQRKIFKEDIQELLYGSTDRPQHPQWRRPVELLYFECSLLNCYGLKSLHQYFGIPFLQLKLATIRQQMRIVEGEFAHLKHDLQVNISEQRYADYVEHIRTTGSDIRTGKRAAGGVDAPAPPKRNGSVKVEEATRHAKPVVLDEDMKQSVSPNDDESIVMIKENRGEVSPETSPSEPTTVSVVSEPTKEEQKQEQGFDTEDLPARSTFADSKGAVPLKFEHQESVTSMSDEVAGGSITVNAESETITSEEKSSDIPVAANTNSSRPRKASIEEVIHLEDFQVPKTRAGMNDLDHFYSEDESDDDGGEYDEDVVVAPANGGMKGPASGAYHKQRFLDSDSSDSEDTEIVTTRSVQQGKMTHKNTPRNVVAKQADNAVGTFNVGLDTKQMNSVLEDDSDEDVPTPEERHLPETLPPVSLKVTSLANQLQEVHVDNDAIKAPGDTAAWEESGGDHPSASSGVAVPDSSFENTDVMEAIRKAQREAMRMLPPASAPVDDADSSSRKRHKHKKSHKKEKSSKRGHNEAAYRRRRSWTVAAIKPKNTVTIGPTRRPRRTVRNCKTAKQDAQREIKAARRQSQLGDKNKPEIERDGESDNQKEEDDDATDDNAIKLKDELLVMQSEIETLQRRRLLLDSALVNSRTNAVTHAIGLTKGFFVHFSNGFDPVHHPVQSRQAEEYLRGIMRCDAICTEFRGVDLFLNQYKACTAGHASLRMFVHDIAVINESQSDQDGAIQILAKGVVRYRVSRATLEKFFPRVIEDEVLAQELIGKEYSMQYDKVFHFQHGRVFQHELRVDLCNSMLELTQNPFVAMKLLEASLMTKHGHLKLDHNIVEDMNQLENSAL